MAPKRKADFPTLESLLEQPWCYYCEKECSDLNSLQDHQKAMHLKCTTCGKKMNTIGGLKVHCETVHKVPLAVVENAKPERASVDGPEIFLMQGIPIELVDQRRNIVIDAYNKKAAEYYKNTGKPLPGSIQEQQHQAPASKKVKVAVPHETPEQKKARLAEHIAKKRAEKAQREAAAKANGGASIEQEHAMPMKQEGAAAIQQESSDNDPAQETDAYFKPQPTSTSFAGYSAPAVSQPMSGYPYQQGFNYGGSPQFGYPPPAQYGQQPSFPNAPHAYPQQPFGYGGPPHGGYPPQPMASHSPVSNTSPVINTEQGVGSQRKSTMPPAAPGLPQKPNFVTPSYSKDEMTKFHSGSAATKSLTGAAATRSHNGKAAIQNPPNPAESKNHAGSDSAETMDPYAKFGNGNMILDHPQNMWHDPELVKSTQDIRDGLEDLVEAGQSKDGAQSAAKVAATASAPQASMASKQAPATLAFRPARQVFSDNVNSPEEKMSRQPRYSTLTPERRRNRAVGTVQEQADSQAVTGSVADDLEQ